VHQNEHFAPFVAHALYMRSSSEEPRKNSTHVVMVHVKQVFRLGEIIALEKYSLVKMRDAKKEIKRRSKVKLGNLLDPGGVENNAIVVFSSGESKMDIYQVVPMVKMIEPTNSAPNSGPPPTKLLTAEESNDQANAAFDALRHIKLPFVQTPDLH
jgi:hypothetical protein